MKPIDQPHSGAPHWATAQPTALQPHRPPPVGSHKRREGTWLVATKGVDLGGACIKCGSTNAPHRRQVNLWKLPTVAYLALIFSLPAFVVIAMLTRKKSDHWINLCSPCNQAWNKAVNQSVAAGAFVVGAPTAAILTALAGLVTPTVMLAVVGPLLGAAGLVASARKRLTAMRIDATEVRIQGVSEAYMQRALPPAAAPWDGGASLP